ncbi:MAG TPA: HAD family hydrolase [Armatimonadota bacterium]|jgi:FMN phosphatase YigB (HAD superfamily)
MADAAQYFQWVFFDIGSVLMDEDPWRNTLDATLFESLRAEEPDLTRQSFDAWMAMGHEQTAAAPLTWVLRAVLPDEPAVSDFRRRRWELAAPTYYQYGVPAEGAVEALETLRGRYRLGIIANQLPEIHAWMDRYDLDRFFEFAAYDCDLGFGKPDSRLFSWALERAGCEPGRAIMVGDRVDNDVAPAKSVGMAAIRMYGRGEYGRVEPRAPSEMPDACVRSMTEIPAAVELLDRRRGAERA